MSENKALLQEFETLIETIGTEVSERISKEVSMEAADCLMKETIFPELQELQEEIGELLENVPDINQEILSNISNLNQATTAYKEEISRHKNLLDQQEEIHCEEKEIVNKFRDNVQTMNRVLNYTINDSSLQL